MKKVLGIMAVVAVSALMFTSCGKTCNCTRYEDGKKVSVQSSAQENGVKYFNNNICKNQSVTPEKGYTWESYQNYLVDHDESKLIECTVEIKCK